MQIIHRSDGNLSWFLESIGLSNFGTQLQEGIILRLTNLAHVYALQGRKIKDPTKLLYMQNHDRQLHVLRA